MHILTVFKIVTHCRRETRIKQESLRRRRLAGIYMRHYTNISNETALDSLFDIRSRFIGKIKSVKTTHKRLYKTWRSKYLKHY